MRSASAKLVGADGHDHELLHVDVLSACAPPLMTFISGTGRTCAFVAADVAVEPERRARRPRRGRPPASPEDRVGAEAALVGRAVELDQRSRRSAAARRPARACEPRRDLVVHVAARRAARPCRRTRARRRAARPPRARRSRRPTARRRGPRARSRAATSTSTVGLPRESRIWRAWTSRWRSCWSFLLGLPRRAVARGGRAWRPDSSPPARSSPAAAKSTPSAAASASARSTRVAEARRPRRAPRARDRRSSGARR